MSQKIRNLLITMYILFILGISASVKAEQNAFPISGLKQEIKSFYGELAESEDGKFYLVISETKYYELANVQNISAHTGKNVRVDGVVIKHKVGPVFELMSLDPLSIDERERKVVPVLIVYKISELSE